MDPTLCVDDRIRSLKDTGATNLPLHAFVKNQIWLDLNLAGHQRFAEIT